MVAEKMHYCWEIMQCDEETPCQVKKNNIRNCWEWMKSHDLFQSQYDLCSECIVYLCNTENDFLSDHELDQVMIRRGLYQKEIFLCDIKLD